MAALDTMSTRRLPIRSTMPPVMGPVAADE